MNITYAFIRTFIVVLSAIFMIAYAIGTTSAVTPWTIIWGASIGVIIGGALIAFDLLFKRFPIRAFNITALGLLFGYLMGIALLVIFNAIVSITGSNLRQDVLEIIKIFLLLFGLYLGVMMTLRSADEISISIPFIRFTPTVEKTKDILIDASALSDPRMIDLAASGLLDHRLIIPRFLLKELHEQEEAGDEMMRTKARRALEVVKKLETLPELHLRYHDTDFPEIKETQAKMLRLARLLDANVLTADNQRIQTPSLEGVRIINIHSLSNAIKPLMQKGEFLKIKIQRYGKEDRQGVGYLEDGTMVVVNGGGDFIGETIKARVLSVKHTTSGRIIFCNVSEEEMEEDEDYDEEEY